MTNGNTLDDYCAAEADPWDIITRLVEDIRKLRKENEQLLAAADIMAKERVKLKQRLSKGEPSDNDKPKGKTLYEVYKQEWEREQRAKDS